MTRGRQVGGKVGFRLVHRHVWRRPAHRPEVASDHPGACARATYTLTWRLSLIAIGCKWSKRKSHPPESNRRPTDYGKPRRCLTSPKRSRWLLKIQQLSRSDFGLSWGTCVREHGQNTDSRKRHLSRRPSQVSGCWV